MHSCTRTIAILLLLTSAAAQAPSQQPQSNNEATASDLFTKDVQPILASRCYTCHSGSQPKGQLNLAIKSLALQCGASGASIIPWNTQGRLLLHRVLGTGVDARMPLGSAPLTSDQIDVLRRWIDAGAKWPDTPTLERTAAPKHWAYVKATRPALPAVKDSNWSRNGIDRFVLARLEKEGLKASPEASKETLIRRVSLDLIGLPPSPAEVDAFLNDTRVDAYERLVDRLLASPRYGERWATPWLDLARYGDSEGWTNDRQRVGWPYRDWVIRAFNQNMPFDRFTIEQIAGDMLPNATDDQKIATGFVRSSMLQSEGGTDPEENNWNAQIDRTSTLGTVWLGSSLGCAQCHDHKYDPFTQKQFYQMVAFFNNSGFSDEPPDPRLVAAGVRFCCIEPRLDLPTSEQAQKRDAINAELKEYERQLKDASPQFQKQQADWERAVLASEQGWQPLQSIRSSSSHGTTLATSPDGSILATGTNPENETYIVEGKAPFREITGIRIEALPHPSLPGGGPGRDYYGNAVLRQVSVETGPSTQELSPVTFKETLTDNAYRPTAKQVWVVDATGQSATTIAMMREGVSVKEGRLRAQLLLVPEKPLKTDADGVLRIVISHSSDIGANLGYFRVSVTAAENPRVAVDVPFDLRPVLAIAPQNRTAKQIEDLAAHYRTVAPELAPVRQK